MSDIPTQTIPEKEEVRKHIRDCPICKRPMEVQTGVNKVNIKKLFRAPNLDDLITLFIIIMVIISAYAYKLDTKTCRETLSNITNICKQYSFSELQEHTSIYNNLSKMNISFDNVIVNNTGDRG